MCYSTFSTNIHCDDIIGSIVTDCRDSLCRLHYYGYREVYVVRSRGNQYSVVVSRPTFLMLDLENKRIDTVHTSNSMLIQTQSIFQGVFSSISCITIQLEFTNLDLTHLLGCSSSEFDYTPNGHIINGDWYIVNIFYIPTSFNARSN